MLLGCIAAAIAGCTHSNTTPPGSLNATDTSLIEAACEDNLLYLGTVIKELSAKKGPADARLVEAMEIYRLAESLYLQKQFELASELIEDAISILEEPGD